MKKTCRNCTWILRFKKISSVTKESKSSYLCVYPLSISEGEKNKKLMSKVAGSISYKCEDVTAFQYDIGEPLVVRLGDFCKYFKQREQLSELREISFYTNDVELLKILDKLERHNKSYKNRLKLIRECANRLLPGELVKKSEQTHVKKETKI